MKPGLPVLFNVEDPSVFLNDYWPNHFFLGEGPNDRLQGLTDYSFEDLLKMECGQVRGYRAVNGEFVRVRVTKGQERALYESGFTIYFIELRHPVLENWLKALERDLGLAPGAARISAFASRRGDGLTPHFDGNDNFVCQARGAKRWRLAENTHTRYPTIGYVTGEKPLSDNYLEAPAGLPAELPTPFRTVELRPGSVMFVPRGMWHATETVESESLHFNIRAALPIWRDLVEYALKNTGGALFDEMRVPITDLFEGEEVSVAIQEELKRRIRGFADAICGIDLPLQREYLHRFIVRSRKIS